MSNLCGSLMNCAVQIRILRFVLLSKASFPYNRTLISLYWLSDGEGGGGRVCQCLLSNSWGFHGYYWKNWHYRKRRTVVSASMLQEHNGFKVSSKLDLDVNKIIWISSTYYKLYYKYHTSTKNVLKILTIICLEIPFRKAHV